MRDPLAGYSNLLDRPQGRVLRTLGVVLPGVRRVASQVEPYAAWWAARNRQALAADGPLWVALGDSMSQGIGASAPDRGWVGQAAAALGGPRVVNLSQSGARAQDVVRFQLPVLRALPAPAVVTVLVGANDLGTRARRVGLLEAFDRLLAQLPAGTVVAEMPQPVAAAQAVNEAIADAAQRRGIVPVRAAIDSWRGRLADDHFHPNDAGYAGIAAAFLPELGSVRAP